MECYNQELKIYLCIFCEGQLQKWLELLPMAKFAHNTAIHSVTSNSLFLLIMRYEPQSYPPLRRTFLPALYYRRLEPSAFFPLLPSSLSHILWDMITNNEGIFSEIWNQFIGGDVPSIAF